MSTPPLIHSEDSNPLDILCELCDARVTANSLIRRRLFEDALAALERIETIRSCLCERRMSIGNLDINGNVVRSSAERNYDALSRLSVAKHWALVSCCRIERAMSCEKSIRCAWELVSKRQKKKYTTCAEYLKSFETAARKVPTELKSFHALCAAYLADVRGALDAAETALATDSEFGEAHLHVARAIFRMENPVMSGGEERKTISATSHVAKYLKQYGDDGFPPDFNPTLWLFLKELNHALFLDAVTLSPAFDSIRFYDNVFLIGSQGPACFEDLATAAKFALDAGMNEVSFLLSPGRYDASFGDVELPEGTRFDVVGNVEPRSSGLRWRQVLRTMNRSACLVSSLEATGFSLVGSVDVSFSRLAFVQTPSRDSSTSLINVSDGATATIDSCSVHCEEPGGNWSGLSSPGADISDKLQTPNESSPSFGIAASADGVLNVSNSILFHLSSGAQIDDGGLIHLSDSTFFDAGFSASDNAIVFVSGGEFVNSEFFALNNCQIDMTKSTFKRQMHHQRSSTAQSPLCLVKIRKGTVASISNCRFFAGRLASLERVALDEREDLTTKAESLTGETSAVSVGGAGTQVTLNDNVFSHVDKCVTVSDKAKIMLSKSKFLDCGEMVVMSAFAKVSLEDNHPCTRMIPVVLLDEDTDPPEMMGPNTYRVERRCLSPSPADLSTAFESPDPASIVLEQPGKGRQFCHHCCGDLVRIPPKKLNWNAAHGQTKESSPSTALTQTTKGKDSRKKKSRAQSASYATPKIQSASSKSARTKKAADSPQSDDVITPLSNPRRPRPSLSTTSVSSASAGGSSGYSSPRNRSFSSTTPSPRIPCLVSSTPSPRGVISPRDSSSPTAFLFCSCGSSYCSRDCQAEDWKDHRLVCSGKKAFSKSRKFSLDLP